MIKLKRLIALYIDLFIAIFTATIIMEVITLGNFSTITSILLICILCTLYIILIFKIFIRKDLIFKNASIGKKILGLQILDANNNIPDKKVLINRNKDLFPLFPLDILYIILYNQTTTDKKYHTKVEQKTNRI